MRSEFENARVGGRRPSSDSCTNAVAGLTAAVISRPTTSLLAHELTAGGEAGPDGPHGILGPGAMRGEPGPSGGTTSTGPT